MLTDRVTEFRRHAAELAPEVEVSRCELLAERFISMRSPVAMRIVPSRASSSRLARIPVESLALVSLQVMETGYCTVLRSRWCQKRQ